LVLSGSDHRTRKRGERRRSAYNAGRGQNERDWKISVRGKWHVASFLLMAIALEFGAQRTAASCLLTDRDFGEEDALLLQSHQDFKAVKTSKPSRLQSHQDLASHHFADP
jgi:hypothetical protein